MFCFWQKTKNVGRRGVGIRSGMKWVRISLFKGSPMFSEEVFLGFATPWFLLPCPWIAGGLLTQWHFARRRATPKCGSVSNVAWSAIQISAWEMAGLLSLFIKNSIYVLLFLQHVPQVYINNKNDVTILDYSTWCKKKNPLLIRRVMLEQLGQVMGQCSISRLKYESHYSIWFLSLLYLD